jgi:tellurite resistance protein
MRHLSQQRVESLDRMQKRAALSLEDAVAEGPFVLEAMFLMAAADGEVSADEIERFADSLGSIVPGASEADVERMLGEMSGLLEDEGWDRRARAVASALKGRPGAELAFRLATAVAFVDDSVHDAESSALDEMAMAMGITHERANQIMVEVHDELFR